MATITTIQNRKTRKPEWIKTLIEAEKQSDWQTLYNTFGDAADIQSNYSDLWNKAHFLYRLALAYGHLSEMDMKKKRDSAHILDINQKLQTVYDLLARCEETGGDFLLYNSAYAYRHYRLATELLTCKRQGHTLAEETSLAHEYFDKVLSINPEHLTTLYRKANLILNVQIPSMRYKRFENKNVKLQQLEQSFLDCHSKIAEIHSRGNDKNVNKYYEESQYQQAIYFLDKYKGLENKAILNKLYLNSAYQNCSNDTCGEVSSSLAILERLWETKTGAPYTDATKYRSDDVKYSEDSFGIHFIAYRIGLAHFYLFIMSQPDSESARIHSGLATSSFQIALRLFKQAGLPSDYIRYKYAKLLGCVGQAKQGISYVQNQRAFYIKELLTHLYALTHDDKAYFPSLKQLKQPSSTTTLCTYFMHDITRNESACRKILPQISPYDKGRYVDALSERKCKEIA